MTNKIFHFNNLAEAQTALQQFSKRPPGSHNPEVLTRMGQVMDELGNPQKRLSIIHVAGTSGKTSTVHYIGSLLALTGKKVGISISPYTYFLNERLQINGQNISEKRFCDELAIFLNELQKSTIALAYLELLTAFAYWELDRIGVDYAVIETNAGGRYDATNVANDPSKFCVITDIGYDHMNILGTTLSAIASAKAGIIHTANRVVMLKQELGIVRVIDGESRKVGAHLSVVEEDPREPILGLLERLPLFQQRNWWLAWQAYKEIAERDGLPILTLKERSESIDTVILGRMEAVRYNGQTVLFDAAHNEQKFEALAASLLHIYPNQSFAVLVMVGNHKELRSMLAQLIPLQPLVICSAYRYIEGLPHQARPALEIMNTALEVGLSNAVLEPDSDKAFDILLDSGKDVKVVTGTLYGLGQLHERATRQG